jgi:NTE family protein
VLLAAVRAVPFFRNLPSATLEALIARLRPVEHRRGSIVFSAGDTGDTMYFVESGQVEALTRIDGEPLAVLGPGSFVGEIAVLLDQPRSATVRVTADAVLWELRRQELDHLLGEHPLIGLELSRELSRRLVATNRRVSPTPVAQCVAVHGDVAALATALDEAEPGRIAIVILPGAQPPQAVPDSVLVVSADDVAATTVRAYVEGGSCGRSRLLMLLPKAPAALCDAVLALSEYAVIVGAQVERAPWLDRTSLRQRVLHCDGSPPSLHRASRWIRGRATGLALSSGGSKAVAHIGVIRVLREMGVTIDAVAGSSGGAVVGAALACGLDETEMLEQLRILAHGFQLRRFDFNLIPRTALSKGVRLRQLFDTFFGGRSFGGTQIPLWVVASDVRTGEEVVIDGGPVADGVRASMSMPVFFNPWPYRGRLLIDGAVVNPLPASVLRDAGIRRVIGSNVAGQEIVVDAGSGRRIPNVLQIVVRMMNSMEREMLKTQVPLVDVMIRPRVNTGYSFDFSRMHEFIAEGDRAARQQAGEALATLGSWGHEPPD